MKINKKYRSHLFHRFKDLALVLFVVSFCLFPLLTLTTNVDYETSYFLISLMYLILAFAMPLFFFRYKYYQNASDFYYSLPLNRDYLFKTSLVSGYLVVVVPITVSVIIGMIFASANSTNLFSTLFIEYLNMLFFFSVIYGAVILIIQLCNNVLDTVVSTITIVNFPFILGFLIFGYLNSLTGTQTFNPDFMVFVSPVNNLLFVLYIELSIWVYVLYGITLVVSLVLASMIFYRRGQSSQKFNATRLLKKIIKYLAIFTAFFFISIIGSNNFENKFGEILFAIIASTATFFAVNFIDHRGLKFNFRELISFAILIIILVLLVILLPNFV